MEILIYIIVFLAAVLTSVISRPLQWPAPIPWVIKLYASALTIYLTMVGIIGIFCAVATDSILLGAISIYVTVFFVGHIIRTSTQPNQEFEKAYGWNWEDQISKLQKKLFLKRGGKHVYFNSPKKSHITQNIRFASVPGNDRNLLCDIWQPNASVSKSGLVFIYLHGSAWYLLDKDLGTRTFFSHLAGQGHIIMDVAYRLAPETDMLGMVQDVKRAIAYIKENAAHYGINPDKIVIGGGSAGGHLALLTAYTANNLAFTPIDLEGKDLNVCGVVSLYGPPDLTAMYFHTNQDKTTRDPAGNTKKIAPFHFPDWLINIMGTAYYRLKFANHFEDAGTFVNLFGGHPNQCPELYELYSPITHVNAQCPTTIQIIGAHDVMVPTDSVRSLHGKLVAEKVKSVLHIIPQTDHAFDLILPEMSPSAQAAINDVERFLALQCNLTE